MSRTSDKLDTIAALVAEVSKKQDTFLRLMVLLERKIESMEEVMEEEIRGRLERMEAAQVDSGKLVDRLIEMSLVNQGQAREAAIHRTQSRLENDFSNPQSWTDDEVKEDVWPPPGCDAMDVIN